MQRLQLTYVNRDELFAEASALWNVFADSNPKWYWGPNDKSLVSCKALLKYLEDVIVASYDLTEGEEFTEQYDLVVKRLKSLNKLVFINLEKV